MGVGPLFEAILGEGDVAVLLQNGHSPNIYADFPGVSWTPLHLAVYRRLEGVVQALLAALANPNAQALPSTQDGPLRSLVGLTSVDLAVTLDQEALVALLVRNGGRSSHLTSPPLNRARETLRHELAKARCVGSAESLVVEPLFLPQVQRAQHNQDWEEADRLLMRILTHEGEGEQTFHLRIRGLLARRKLKEALDEASLIFLNYRRQGRYLEALRVARGMRLIDPRSCRPYDLEMEFLSELGWLDQAHRCLHQLVELHIRTGRTQDIPACRARFEILRRRPGSRASARHPGAWTVPEALSQGSSANLPALPEEDPPSWWTRLRQLWWGSEGAL